MSREYREEVWFADASGRIRHGYVTGTCKGQDGEPDPWLIAETDNGPVPVRSHECFASKSECIETRRHL